MKVLSLCTSPDLGGLELYAVRSVEMFAEAGILEATVCKASTRFQELVEGCQINTISLDPNGIWPISAGRTVAKLIDSRGVDLIHVNWGQDLNLAVLAKRFSRRKPALVYSRHMRIPGSKLDVYHRWIYKHVDCLLATTSQIYSQARSNLPLDPNRIHHLYLGVCPKQLASEVECLRFFHDAKLAKGPFTIGLPGRIERSKGQHLLIDAVGILINKGCDVQAWIGGHPMSFDYYKDLEIRIARSGLKRQISLQGHTSNISRFMTCFDLVVLTSDCEHFGMVLIEAMHAGVAVIGTNAGGVPEIINNEKTGLLCEPGNATDLAEKIELLYRDTLKRKALAKQGQRRAFVQFSEKEHFHRMYSRFKQIVAEST